MKKLLCAIMGIMMSLGIFAQMNSGSYFTSASIPLDLSIYSSKDLDSPDSKQSNFDIQFNPKVGYFFKNRIALGGIVDYSINRYSFDDGSIDGSNVGSYSERALLFGPLGRYYLEYGSLIPFAEAFIGFGRSSTKESSDFDGEKTTTITKHSVTKMAVGGGANYFLNESIALEALLQYFWYKQKPTEQPEVGGLGHVDTGIMLTVGVSVYFGSI